MLKYLQYKLVSELADEQGYGGLHELRESR